MLVLHMRINIFFQRGGGGPLKKNIDTHVSDILLNRADPEF